MRTSRLGKTGLQVSRVGIGGIPIVRPSEADAIAVVRRALDLGITLIDTANRQTGSLPGAMSCTPSRAHRTASSAASARPDAPITCPSGK